MRPEMSLEERNKIESDIRAVTLALQHYRAALALEHRVAHQRFSLPRYQATLRTRGFAFVEMQDDKAGAEAIRTLNGSQLDGRTIVVSEARPDRKERTRAAPTASAASVAV